MNLSYPFTWCQKWDWKRKDSHRSCGQQFNSEEWCKSEKLQRAIETNNMASASFIDKGPSIDWCTDENLYGRFKMWKLRCELLFTGPMAKIDEEININIFYTGLESRVSNCSIAGTCLQTTKNSWTTTGKELSTP